MEELEVGSMGTWSLSHTCLDLVQRSGCHHLCVSHFPQTQPPVSLQHQLEGPKLMSCRSYQVVHKEKKYS